MGQLTISQDTSSANWLRRWRPVLTGLALVPINVYFLLYMEQGRKGVGPFPSTLSLFANCVLFLLILTVANRALARRWPARAFSQGELLVVYVMLVISTAIMSFDFVAVLPPMMTYPFRMASPENQWREIIWPYVPEWITVRDPVALEAWYRGHSTMYDWRNLKPWLLPLGVWSVVILVMLFVMFCINTIVRVQWMRHDRLTFPIVTLPLQLTDPSDRLLNSRLMWLGFAIAGGITFLNGMHQLYPTLPFIPVKMTDVSSYFVSSPWNSMGTTYVSFYPFAIGLGFLLPLNTLFSCWFFYAMWRVLRIVLAGFGYTGDPAFPYADHQALGAYYMIALFALWSGRRHLASVLRSAFKGTPGPEEDSGPMRYRTAVLGVVLGTAALMLFFHLIGIRVWVAVVGVLLYFLMILAIARIHAEFGPPSHELYGMGPQVAMVDVLGSTAFPRSDLNGLSWFWWFNRAYDSQPIAYQLDGMRIADRSGVTQRYMGAAIALASVAALVSGFWIYLHFAYERGAEVGMAGFAHMYGREAFANQVVQWVESPTGPDAARGLAIGWGMLFAWFLYFATLRFAWWPFHPLGFAVSTSWTMGTLWFPMFIAWCAKVLAFRLGGLKAYRVALQFFLGLLLGDFVVGIMWPLVGWVLNVDTYCFTQ